jgi:hypothetical protein
MWARLLACLCVIDALEQRADFSKRGTAPHHGDEGRLLLEPIAKPSKEDVDELAIRHGIAEYAELVGHGLDTLAVDAEGGGPLDGVADLGVEVVDPGVDVVLEELAQSRPESSGGGGLAEDEVEDLGGDTRVDPLDDGEVVSNPARISGAWNGVVGDVITKAAAPKVNLEEMAPVIVVVLGEIEGNGDKGSNVGYGVCKGERCSHGGVGGGRSRV